MQGLALIYKYDIKISGYCPLKFTGYSSAGHDHEILGRFFLKMHDCSSVFSLKSLDIIRLILQEMRDISP